MSSVRAAIWKTVRLEFPVTMLCKTLGVSRSGFYDWLHARPAARAQEDVQLKVLITAARRQSRETDGTRRVKHELAAQGHDVGRDRVGWLPRVLELRCKQRRKLVAMTNSRHDLPVSENLLEQRFTPTRPDEVWLTDITYIPTAEGWLYLAGLNDVFTCEIVGNAMGERMTQDLTAQALWRAVANKRPAGPDPPFGPRQSILRPRVPRSGGAAWHAIVIDDIEQTKAHSSSAPTAALAVKHPNAVGLPHGGVVVSRGVIVPLSLGLTHPGQLQQGRGRQPLAPPPTSRRPVLET
jgi:hypothetical protein